ncbi:MAG: LamG-like jellyroll fold domain-containing protein [Akkermansiaceae bacterium]
MKTNHTLNFLLGTAALTVLAKADYPGVVNTDNPLAYYRFEEAAGATTLVDSSGNGLDIDYSAPIGTTEIGVPGGLGLGVLFNADGSLLTPLLLDPSVGDFTIEAVIRADEPGAAGTVVIANQDGAGGIGRSNLVVNGNRAITTFSGGQTTAANESASEGRFDHIILTYDQSAGALGETTFRFWVNGEERGMGTAVAEGADGSWVIGSHKSQASQFFSGVIDEVSIYDKRLDDPNGDGDNSDSRVSAHYKEYLTDTDTVVSFESDVPYLDGGQSATLSWKVSPVLTALTIDDGTGPVDVLADTVDCFGTMTVSPTVTTTYTISGEGPLGTESIELTVVVDEPAVVDSFTSNFDEIPAGGQITLSWEVSNGTSVSIDNGVGPVDNLSGSATATITGPTTFTLTATNSQGDVTAQVTIDIIALEHPNLITHWKVGEAEGEAAGSALISEAGPAFAGTFVGNPTFDTSDPAPVPGGSTASIVFDGEGSWIDVLGYNGIGGSDARTVAFWFKGPATQTMNNATLVSWGTGATGQRFDTRVNNNSSGIIRTEVSGSGSNGTAVIADDTWHHCAVVFDPTEGTTIGTVKFYIDGVLDTLSVVGGTELNTSLANPLRIGASRALPNRSLTGKMDDIRIYNAALAEDEILALYEFQGPEIIEVTDLEVLGDGSVQLTWSASPGEYALEYSFDLEDGNWIELSDSEVIEDGETEGSSVDSSIAPNAANTKVFYRFLKID